MWTVVQKTIVKGVETMTKALKTAFMDGVHKDLRNLHSIQNSP